MSNQQEKNYSITDLGKVAVLMGGSSAERPISLQSGAAVLDALKQKNINAHKFDTAERALSELKTDNFDRAFIALHGRCGEDGVIQGALEMMEMPYTGSGVLASALAMDKIKSKHIWRGLNLPTPDFIPLQQGFDVSEVVSSLGLPLMVKPAREGSSIGATKVKNADQLDEAFHQAFALDDQVVAETWISGGGEYTVPILMGRALPSIQLKTDREFYDYQAKYESDTTEYICPCGLEQKQQQQLNDLALAAFQALGCETWGRVDVLLDAEAQPWLIEVNTVPGMTSHSLVPMGAKQDGISFPDLVETILASTLIKEIQ